MSAMQPAPGNRFTDVVVKLGLAVLLGMGALIIAGAIVLSIASIVLTESLDLG